MKICVINNIFYPYSRGGADKVSKTIVDEFLQNGDEVFVITTKPRKSKIDSGKYSVYYLYSKFQTLSQIPSILRLFWHIGDNFNLINYFKIKKILKKEKPDLVLSNNLKGIGFLTPYCVKKQGIKHIHILHDIQLIYPSGLMYYGEEKKINTYLSKIYCKINNFLFTPVDTIISPSKWLLSFHKEKGFFNKNKSLVIPNPIKIKIDNQNNTKKLADTFICIGEIEKHKGVLFLVKVFKDLNKKGKHYKIIFIGKGKESDKIKKEAKKHNFITYLGKLENKKVLAEIAKARALIMPSLCYENSPSVIYEAYSQKTPVIASRIGGITELVRSYGGLLFKPKDEKDLIKKIEYITQIKEKKLFRKLDINNLKSNSYIKKIKSL